MSGVERRCIALVESLSIDWIDGVLFSESGVFMSLGKMEVLGRDIEC